MEHTTVNFRYAICDVILLKIKTDSVIETTKE